MASDAGYGFICKYEDLLSKSRSGKALLTLPVGAEVLAPLKIDDLNTKDVLAITNEGRILVFPVSELPQLSKGKGNKIINIAAARAKEREELLTHLVILPQDAHVTLYAGKRKLNLSPKDIDHFRGDRGRRGSILSRGLQRVSKIEITE